VLQLAAQRRPQTYGRFFDDLVGPWVQLVAGLLTARGVEPAAARALATLLYAAVRGLQRDLLATGDRDRADAGFAELIAALERRLAGPRVR